MPQEAGERDFRFAICDFQFGIRKPLPLPTACIPDNNFRGQAGARKTEGRRQINLFMIYDL
ncbi:MAG: hypothetical protein JW749_00615 [Sedimentisphaerales bacterium]|nr:hypothetical protein [Sedimentisphaerales bacterium]